MKTFGGHFRKSDPKVSKSIGFISKNEYDFAESQNLIKPCKNQHFAKVENALWKPL